jgi:hypothetical protein
MTEVAKPPHGIPNNAHGPGIGVDERNHPRRIVKTDGFERLFSHHTGLHGDALMEYLVDFQNKALEVRTFVIISYAGFSLWMHFQRRLCRFAGTCTR